MCQTMADPAKAREQLRLAREELDASEAALSVYESAEEREQRELARADHCWRYARERLTSQVREALAAAAEADGEGWLFEAGVLAADGIVIQGKEGKADA